MAIWMLAIIVINMWITYEVVERYAKKADKNFESVGKDIKLLYEWNEAITNEIDKLCRLIGKYREENKELKKELERRDANKDDV